MRISTARTSRYPKPNGCSWPVPTVETLEKALLELPPEFREAIVLRELEGLSYKEISEIANVPVGTVMSRLARARARLQLCLAPQVRKEA